MKTAIKFFLFFVVVLSGCRQQPPFQQSHYFPGDKWRRFDFVRFKIPVSAGDSLDMDLTVIHGKTFNHKQLRLNVTVYKPDGEYRSRDVLLHLKGKKGEWISQPADSGYLQKTVHIAKALHFSSGDTCTVRIEHKIPFYEIEGVHKLVLKARKPR